MGNGEKSRNQAAYFKTIRFRCGKQAFLARLELLPLCREKSDGPFEEFFGRDVSDPLAPVTLEVIERSADEALTRLVATVSTAN